MKAICIIGSPNENGNTAFIVDKIIQGMSANNIDIKRYVLGSMNINYCKGCKSCYETRRCVQQDDMELILKEMSESDVVLIASPSYWGNVTGQLKVFFDRCTPWCDTLDGGTTMPKGKIGISIAIRAGQSEKENQHIIHEIAHYFSHLGIRPVKSLTIEGILHKADFEVNPKKLHDAHDLGLSVIDLCPN
jgi:multimeric flavodoxin WrbA